MESLLNPLIVATSRAGGKGRAAPTATPIVGPRRRCLCDHSRKLKPEAGATDDLSSTEILARGAVALAVGLLAGLERERRKGEGDDRQAAGIRTFAAASLAGFAGAVAGTAIFAVAVAGVAALAVVSYLRASSRDPGLTTEVAMVAIAVLGGLTVHQPTVSAAAGVILTTLLAFREPLHLFSTRLVSDTELRDALVLAGAAIVVLPLLPDKGYGPAEALNPFAIWRLVVIVMVISGLGYVATRAVGPRFGFPAAGLAGGFVSSSATIGSMGALARRAPEARRAAVAGAVLSTVATYLQMAGLLAVTSSAVLRELALPLAAGGAAALIAGAIAGARVSSVRAEEAAGRRPFEIKDALVFAALVTGVSLASGWIHDVAGPGALTLSAAVAGLADTHAAAAAVAALVASGEVPAGEALLPIVAGLTSNTASKAVIAYVTGGPRFAVVVWLGLGAVLGATWAGLVVSRTL
ncbi:MAG: MgtC/SapB family protein [Dehalococcoidia bacterium]